jgi:hypothetical protein
MTQEEIKKFDKRIRNIQDPFGTGFLSLYTIIQEMAEYKGKSQNEIIRQYFIWKLKSF